MSYRIEFDAENRIIRSTFSGSSNDEEFRAYFVNARKCMRKVQPVAAIIDLSQVTGSDVSTHAITEMARSKPVIPDPMVPIYVIAPADHIFGTSRMFQLIGGNTRPLLQIVRSAEEAYSQLKLKAEMKFEPLSAD